MANPGRCGHCALPQQPITEGGTEAQPGPHTRLPLAADSATFFPILKDRGRDCCRPPACSKAELRKHGLSCHPPSTCRLPFTLGTWASVCDVQPVGRWLVLPSLGFQQDRGDWTRRALWNLLDSSAFTRTLKKGERRFLFCFSSFSKFFQEHSCGRVAGRGL